MYLSNRDIKWAIDCKQLIVDPPPENFNGYDETSIDLHLGPIDDAQIWDVEKLKIEHARSGNSNPELHLGTFRYEAFGGSYLISPPGESKNAEKAITQLVAKRENKVIVKPGGFLLWQTQETVGTPVQNPDFICFVNAKSTKARTGIIVHFTAPTIHAGWSGKITLEIANHGPFHFVLQEGDAIAQLTVAYISSPPDPRLKKGGSQTLFQTKASGFSPDRPAPKT